MAVRNRRTTRRVTGPRTRVLPYKPGSKSAKLLAQALTSMRLKTGGASKFVGRGTDTIVNWGSSATPHNVTNCKFLNNPRAVALSSNKLTALTRLKEAGVPCIEFTTDVTQVERWLDSGEVVFARTLLNSHSGRGIVQLEGDVTIPRAPLYTLYKKKKHEYRVHVLPDGSVAIRQKRKRLNVETIDYRVRNFAGGFIFAQELSFLPNDLEQVARDAVKALGLDFGALDILWNERDNKSYVLECNSAPGLEGSSVELYAAAFRRRLARGV